MGIPRRELLSSKLDASGIERRLQEPLCVDTSINYELDSAMFPGLNQPGNTQQPVLMIAGHQSVRWEGKEERREYNQSHSQNNGVYLAQNPTRTQAGCTRTTESNKNLHKLSDRQLTQCTDDQLDLMDVNPGDLVCGLKDRAEYLRLVEDVVQGVPSSLELQYTQGPICISDSPPVSPTTHHHSTTTPTYKQQPSHNTFLTSHHPSIFTSPIHYHSSSVSGLDSNRVNCSQRVGDESHGTKCWHTKDSAQSHLRVNGRQTAKSGDTFTNFMNERLMGDGFNGPLSHVTNVHPLPQHAQSVMASFHVDTVSHSMNSRSIPHPINSIPHSVNSSLHSTNPALHTVKHTARVIPQNHVNHVVKQEPNVNPSFPSVNGVHYSVNHTVRPLNPLPHVMSPAASRPLHTQQDHTSQHQSFCPGDNYSVLSDLTGAGFISAGYASNVMGDASKKRKRVDASTDFQKRACSDYVKFVRNQQVRVM